MKNPRSIHRLGLTLVLSPSSPSSSSSTSSSSSLLSPGRSCRGRTISFLRDDVENRKVGCETRERKGRTRGKKETFPFSRSLTIYPFRTTAHPPSLLSPSNPSKPAVVPCHPEILPPRPPLRPPAVSPGPHSPASLFPPLYLASFLLSHFYPLSGRGTDRSDGRVKRAENKGYSSPSRSLSLRQLSPFLSL